MDTSIYIGLGLQFLSQTINVWVNAPSNKKTMEEISSQVCNCLDDIRFKPLYVLCLQLVGAYISKEMINLCECISYPLW